MKYKLAKELIHTEEVSALCPHCDRIWLDDSPSLWKYQSKKGVLVRCKLCKKLFIVKLS